mmetsp:Transcript_90968/g.278466  ORF Transcript_90968/g.278466 Transcript_90968/m.278466 type:complete len:259 (-) Transcript_90968:1208-1984(-)
MARNRTKSKNSSGRSTPSPYKSKMVVKRAHCSSVTAYGPVPQTSATTAAKSCGFSTPDWSWSSSTNRSWHFKTKASPVSHSYMSVGSSGTTLWMAFLSRSITRRISSMASLPCCFAMFCRTWKPSSVSMNAMITMKRDSDTNSPEEITPVFSASKRPTKCRACSSVRLSWFVWTRSMSTGMSSAGSSVPLLSTSRALKSAAHCDANFSLSTRFKRSCGKKGMRSPISSMPCRTASSNWAIFCCPSRTSASTISWWFRA